MPPSRRLLAFAVLVAWAVVLVLVVLALRLPATN